MVISVSDDRRRRDNIAAYIDSFYQAPASPFSITNIANPQHHKSLFNVTITTAQQRYRLKSNVVISVA